MRKLRVFLVELILVGIFVGWVLVTYPALIDRVIPWILFVILWHVTWEFVLQSEAVRSWTVRTYRKRGAMVWVVAFLVGGLISLGYLYSVMAVTRRVTTRDLVEVRHPPAGLPETPENRPDIQRPGITAPPSSPPPNLSAPESVEITPNQGPPAPILSSRSLTGGVPAVSDRQGQAQIGRRRDLLDRLRNEYILSHDNISPSLMAGTEQPPADWINKRLGELGEKWRIPVPPPSPPISETLRFTTVVPINESSKNAPVPISSNFNDPKSDFYQDLFGIANRPDQAPDGTTFKERKLDTSGDKFVFVTRLIQYYVLHSIRVLQGGRQGTRWTSEKGVTAIDVAPIPAPDAVPYSTDTLIHDLGDNEFLPQSDRMLWKARPFQLPNGTIVSLKEKPSGNGPLECTVRFERPGYYRIDFVASPSISVTGRPPAGFESTLTAVSSYPVTLTMTYEIQRRGDGNFQPEIYARWADDLFSGLKNIMAP